MENLVNKLRSIPDYPVKGVLFRDVTTLFKDAAALREIVDRTYDLYKDKGITRVVGVESRGFVVGAALAVRLGAGFVLARKPGKLPAPSLVESYYKEYGKDTVEIHEDALSADDVVLIHDDILATGGTVAAVEKLVRRFGVENVFMNFIIELEGLGGRAKITPGVEITTLMELPDHE